MPGRVSMRAGTRPGRPHGALPPNRMVEARAKAGGRRGAAGIAVFSVALVMTAVLLQLVSGSGSSAQGADATQMPGGGDGSITGRPVITEVMACNKGTLTDGAGAYGDWIELSNPTDRNVDLKDFALSDNPKKPGKCTLPSYILAPGESAVVFADGRESTEGELHVPFKLDSSGQDVLLSDAFGNPLQQVECPKMKADRSYALDLETGAWALTDDCTPGFPNTALGLAAFQETRRAEAPIRINEAMAANALTLRDGDGDWSDWVELANPSGEAVDLTGWGLSNREDDPKRWVFPKTVIGPGEYLLVFLSGKNRAEEGGELHADFKLDAADDTVLLSNLFGQIVSEIQINDQKYDESLALLPGEDGWRGTAQPTPGYPNDEAGRQAFQAAMSAEDAGSPVVICEVMGNNVSTLRDQFGAYPDWIEFHNRSGKDVNLNGWGLTDKADEPGRWRFPDMTLKAGQYLVVFASGKDLADAQAVSSGKPHADFTIGSGGCALALTGPDGAVADRCFVPAPRPGVSFGREEGAAAFGYMASPTPGKANGKALAGAVADPQFSLKAGQYGDAQSVAISTDDPEAAIYYTTDGTPPTSRSKRYTGPIAVSKTTAIRAVALRDGYLTSNAVCATYLIGENVRLPVISLVTDPDNLFGGTGIYDHPYKKDWERPVHVELLEADGTLGISQDAGIQIFGSYSRAQAFKGLAVFARAQYGKGSFEYKVFPNQPFTKFESLVLRPSGNEANFSRMRDALITSLAAESTSALDVQDYRNAVLFVNGEFWGVTQIRERIDEHWLSEKYGVAPDKIDLLEGNGTAKSGSNQEYKDLIAYVKSHDLSVQANYDYVASKIDVGSYIDWYACEICTGNADMGNIRYWKAQGPDGKWRWIFYDFCWGFWPSKIDRKDIEIALDPRGNGANGGHFISTALITGLLKNPGFREKFIERLAYHINVTFAADRVLAKIDELEREMEPYMDRDFRKWKYGTVNTWKSYVNQMRNYCEKHPAKLKEQMRSYFHLSSADMKKLFPE